MKQYIKSEKAMEAENHLKNRARQSNRMSEKKLSRTWMAIAVMMTIVTNAIAQSGYIKNDDLPGFYEISMYRDDSYKLYEDGLSQYSSGLGINFLGIANYPPIPSADGTIKHNYVIYVDTAYVNRGTGLQKPQYMLAVGVDVVNGDEITTDGNDTQPLQPYTIGRYLVNATDSARMLGSDGNSNASLRDARYTLNLGSFLDRLVFVDAIHVHDRLYILSEVNKYLSPSEYSATVDNGKTYIDGAALYEATLSGGKLYGRERNPEDSRMLGAYYDFGTWNNYHNDVCFSFRSRNSDTGSFVIESETTNRTVFGNSMIEPVQGGWIDLINWVPVITRTNDFGNCTVFIMEMTEGPSVHNEAVADATSNIHVIGGTGSIAIHNAAGRKIMISNILGQVIFTGTVSSDMTTVSVPSGIVVVSVEGGISIKVVVQ